MKPMIETANILTKFVSQKGTSLTSLPLLVAMPIRPRSKKVGPLTEKHTKYKGQKSALSVVGLMGCLLLVGCTGSTYSSHFDCPMGEGAGCASISRVNKMIDRQEIDLGNDDIPSVKKGVSSPIEDRLPVESRPHALGNQVYIYYGPDQLSRLISVDESKSLTARESSLDSGSTSNREPTFDRGSTFDQERN